jgi:small-conductance mechanosensitive channel
MVYLVIWAGVVLFALDNLGVDITALVAGLGIGGVAIALALQNVLGDLFASLAIVLDKPFVLGDFVRVDDMVGTVEHVGLKTTRIRALSGEQLVFANNDILGSRLQNFGRMFERRIVFTVGVTYQTPRASLEKIPGIIQDAIEAQDDVRFDRSHLSAYGDFSINFESVWFVLSPDFATYMDRQQAIYFAIHEAFEHAAIEFAYPTQTLFLERGATHEPS